MGTPALEGLIQGLTSVIPWLGRRPNILTVYRIRSYSRLEKNFIFNICIEKRIPTRGALNCPDALLRKKELWRLSRFSIGKGEFARLDQGRYQEGPSVFSTQRSYTIITLLPFSALASDPTARPLQLCLEVEGNQWAVLLFRQGTKATPSLHLSQSSWIGTQKIGLAVLYRDGVCGDTVGEGSKDFMKLPICEGRLLRLVQDFL